MSSRPNMSQKDARNRGSNARKDKARNTQKKTSTYDVRTGDIGTRLYKDLFRIISASMTDLRFILSAIIVLIFVINHVEEKYFDNVFTSTLKKTGVFYDYIVKPLSNEFWALKFHKLIALLIFIPAIVSIPTSKKFWYVVCVATIITFVAELPL